MKSKTIKLFLFTFLMCLGSVGAWADKVILYSQNYDSSNDASSWVTINYAPTLTIDDPIYGNYITFSPGNSNSRSTYTTFGSDFYGDYSTYTLEFDAALTPGNNQTTQLAVMTSGYKKPDNNSLFTDKNSGCNYLFVATSTPNTTKMKLNEDESSTYNNVNGVWCHYKFIVDIKNSIVNYSIVNKSNEATVVSGEYSLPNGTDAKAVGIYFLSGRYYGVLNFDNLLITTEVENDVANIPELYLKKVNGTARTYSISFVEGETLHYKLPGSDEYLTTTETPCEVTVDESGILYAYTTKGTATSEVVETIVDATEIVLPTPEIRVGITEDGNKFIPSFGAVCDNSSVLLNPEITISATLDGVDVTSAVVAGNYTPANSGTLTVTATAEGYTSSASNMFVAAEYSRSWQSVDFSTITIDNVAEYFGDGWSQSANTGRWSSWAEQAYSYLEYKTNTGSSITVNDRIRMRDVVSVVVGYGLGRNVSGNEQIRVLDVKANEIAEFKIYNGYGKRTVAEGSYLSCVVGDGGEVSMNSNNGALLVQASVYTPMTETTFTIDYKTKEGVLIKSETVESTTGSSIEISETQKTAFFLNDDRTIKYYYAEDDSEGKTVMGDGSTVVTIIVDEAVVATTIHDFEDNNNTLFKIYETSRISTSVVSAGDMSTNVADNGSNILAFSSGNSNGVAFAYYNFSDLVVNPSIVNVSFDCYIKTVSGQRFFTIGDASLHTGTNGGFTGKTQWGYGNNGSIFYFGCTRGKANGKTNEDYFSINNKVKASSVSTLKANEVLDQWIHADITVNVKQRKVSYVIKNSEGEILFSEENIDFVSDAATACNQIDFYTAQTGDSYIDNLTITTESVYVIQQLNYQTEDGTILKSDKVKSIGVIKGLPLVIKYEDSYYTLDDDRVSGYSLDARSNYLDEAVTVNYRLSPEIVYFNDAEESTWKFEDSSASGGYVGSWGNDICSTTLDAGLYDVIINVWSKAGSGSNYRRSAVEVNGYVEAMVDDNNNGEHVLSVLVPNNGASFKIYGRGTNKATDNIDYVLVRKTGDLSSVYTTSLTSAGVGTICSPYNLDFTNAENIAAYKAEASDGRINLTRVYNVAAREGVLIRSLNGGAVTEDIPVSATAFDANEGNEFIGTLVDIASQPSEDEEYRYYILSSKTVNGNKVYGFYLANNKKIGAGKAYLRVPLAAAAKYSFFSFDDETTGVEDVELGITETDSPVYDLFGRKVVNPATGLYIKNGKKFIVK